MLSILRFQSWTALAWNTSSQLRAGPIRRGREGYFLAFVQCALELRAQSGNFNASPRFYGDCVLRTTALTKDAEGQYSDMYRICRGHGRYPRYCRLWKAQGSDTIRLPTFAEGDQCSHMWPQSEEHQVSSWRIRSTKRVQTSPLSLGLHRSIPVGSPCLS
jgi:hypothetical protein